MNNSTKYVISFVIVICALSYFVITSMNGDKLYYKPIDEIVNNTELSPTKGLRVTGDVLDENYSVDAFEKIANFQITDESGAIMNVVYKGSLPDAFEQDAQVVLEGTYDGQLFTAYKLLAKCPSKYEAQGIEHPTDIPKK